MERYETDADSTMNGGAGSQNGDSGGSEAAVSVMPDAATDEEVQPQRARTPSFAEMLVEAGMISAQQASQARQTARREAIPLSRVLVRDGLVLSRDLAAFMALHLGLTMVDLRSEILEPEVVGLLPEDIARRYTVLALKQLDGSLTVAMSDPTNLQAIQDLTARTGLTIDPVVASEQELQESIDVAYREVKAPEREGEDVEQIVGGRVTAAQLRTAQPARVIDLLLQQASRDGASDIHIEPTEHNLRIRFRIDSVLQETMTLPKEMHPQITSRIKIMSDMNIAERRRPQDGQLSFETIDGKKTDVRAGIANTIYGEMSVLRLLDSGTLSSLGLDQLGMHQGLERYREMLRLPHGMILVSGPTGSGKSTTLAASLMTINRSELNVITMEDPVENEVPDANQLQVHTEAGVTFAALLRSILRLDPDVVLVGEIRDQETAELAVNAAMTGHLVMSTVHANDSVSTLLRLRDLGVADYQITSALAGIVAQRMVRKVCTTCAVMTAVPLDEQKAYTEVTGEHQERFIVGAGCNSCTGSGYRGRMGIYEVMPMSDELRRLFLAEAPRYQLVEQTIKDGTVLLRADGMMKAKQGLTTPHEIMRVAESEIE